jgi:hypothetical protein
MVVDGSPFSGVWQVGMHKVILIVRARNLSEVHESMSFGYIVRCCVSAGHFDGEMVGEHIIGETFVGDNGEQQTMYKHMNAHAHCNDCFVWLEG